MTSSPRDAAPARNLFSRLWLVTGLASLAVIAALLFVPQFAPWLLRFEYWTADWRTALLSDRTEVPHKEVVVVAITDATLRDYTSSPMDRGLLARIVRAIDAAGAKAIGLDVFFLKKTEPEKDLALIDALKTAKAEIVMGAVDERGQLEEFQSKFQAEFLAGIGRPAGYLNLRRERDDVVRYTAASSPGSRFPKSFARLLAEAGGAKPSDDSRPIAWLRGPDDKTQAFIQLPAHDLLADPDLGSRLKGRIVVVGADRPRIDRHRMPLSVRDGSDVAGVLIHAHTVAMMLEPARAVRELDPTTARLFLMAIALLGFLFGWRYGHSSVIGYLGWGAATGALVVIDAVLFREARLLLPFTLAAVSWVAGLTAGRSMRAGLSAPKFERSSTS